MPPKVFSRLTDRWSFLIVLFAVGLLGYFTYGYLSAWAIDYSSDQALIGLMAKYILEHGERPIFVWSVGYQGVFMEVYPTALMFRFLGQSVPTLNLVPAMYLWGAMALFYFYVKRLFDPKVAAIALLFLVASTPLLYRNCMNAMPNFSSTFLLGMLMLFLFDRVVVAIYENEKLNLASLCSILLFGVVTGFALYTFILSAYYFLTILFFSFLMYLSLCRGWVKKGWWRQVLCPARGIQNRLLRHVLFVLFSALILLVLANAVLFLMGIKFDLLAPAGKRPAEPLHFMVAGIVLHLLAGFVVNFLLYQREKWRRLLGGATLLSGMVAGFSPSLYYWYVLGGRSSKGAAFSGADGLILKRFRIGCDALTSLLNLSGPAWVSFLVKLAIIPAAILFLWSTAEAVNKLFARNDSRGAQKLPRQLLFYLLLPVVIAVFLLSSAVMVPDHGRYLAILPFVFALMLAQFFVALLRGGVLLRAIVVLWIALLVWHNATAISMPWGGHEAAKAKLDSLTRALHERAIKYAYGDYWAAYLVNFYTNEDIVIEPTYSNYAPQYAALVSSHRQVGYIASVAKRPINKEPFLELKNAGYAPVGPFSLVNGEWVLSVIEK